MSTTKAACAFGAASLNRTSPPRSGCTQTRSWRLARWFRHRRCLSVPYSGGRGEPNRYLRHPIKKIWESFFANVDWCWHGKHVVRAVDSL